MDVGVFVLGMHRSGTSAVTRLINLLGVEAPRDGDLVLASNKNPKGYWESMSLVAFNTRVLAAVDCDMSCPVALGSSWEQDPRLEELRGEAKTAVRWTFPSAPWVWKDPRNCLSFAFWRRTLEIRPVVVLVQRNPLEIVASSLRNRPKEGKIYVLALWERYLRQALEQIHGLPVLVVDYETVLSEPLVWCGQAQAFLERAGIEVQRGRDEAVTEFVDADIRHAAFSPEAFLEDPGVSDAQRALFRILVRLVGDHAEFSPPALPPETPTTEALFAERRRTVQARRELQRALELGRRSRLARRVSASMRRRGRPG